MNKLQLYIYKSLRGFKSIRNFNPSENVQRHIRDMRHALEILDYDPAEKYLFYLITYVDEGTFFTILRTIPDQPCDHLATTIFVPNGLKITREEMADIVHRTTRMVSNPSVSAEEVNDLHEIFSKEYPVEPDAPACVPSEGREFAFCLYGGDTGRRLDDFYAEMLYQPDNIEYAGVVLADASLGVTSTARDITDKPLCANVRLLPPDENPDGFTPHIYHHSFDRPFLVPLGGKVNIVWRRGGFEDKVQTVEVKADGQRVEPVSNGDSRKTITPAQFFISAQTGNPKADKTVITNAIITVNGVEISEARTFTLDELKRADVIIRAPGYFPFHTRLDLAATTQALIQLQEQRKIYRFELPVKSSELGAPIHFEIHTKRRLTESPLEGYELLDEIKEGAARSNHLEYTGGRSDTRRYMPYVIGAGTFILGFLLGWLFMSGPATVDDSADDAADSTATATVSVAQKAPAAKAPAAEAPAKAAAKAAAEPKNEPAATPAPAAADKPVTAEAIAYLDKNNKWEKARLDKFPELAGLFDDMNNFRLERLSIYWGERLSKSKQFGRVAHHAGEGLRKKIFKPEGTYCAGDGDHTITIQSYLNRVDPAKK